MITTLFVYGTLKTGEPNHNLMTDKQNGRCRLVGKARTLEKYPLVVATDFNIPFMLLKPGTGNNIEGELYEVDEKRLEMVDDLEKHPVFYQRLPVKVERVGDDVSIESREVTVETYFLVQFQQSLLNLQMHSVYRDGQSGQFQKPSGDKAKSSEWLYEVHTDPEAKDKINYDDYVQP